MNKEIVQHYFAGRYDEALKKISESFDSNSLGFDEACRLVSSIRMEILASKVSNDVSRANTMIDRVQASLHQILLNQELEKIKQIHAQRLELFGWSGGSQNGEDGIIQEIFSRIGTGTRTFAEIGVGNGLQNNTVYLLNQGWYGFWIDGNTEKCAYIQSKFGSHISEKRLSLGCAMVNKENVHDLFTNLDVPRDFDLLSIDVDGNDFHILKALDYYRPRVVVVEYNGLYRPPSRVVQNYDSSYTYNPSTYVGTSLWSFKELMNSRGFGLVGTDIVGINAFFVNYSDIGNKFVDVDSLSLYNSPRTQLAWGGAFGVGALLTPFMPRAEFGENM
jgi:hypothetical protein